MADTSLINNRIGLLIWKTSNYWQSNLRRILYPFDLSLNEYLILQSIKSLMLIKSDIYQNEISELIGVDISVTSVTLKSLENKKIISRKLLIDNRKKIIEILLKGEEIFKIVNPLVQKEEDRLFKKLNSETFNLINSLKLILGRKIRIKAEKKDQ